MSTYTVSAKSWGQDVVLRVNVDEGPPEPASKDCAGDEGWFNVIKVERQINTATSTAFIDITNSLSEDEWHDAQMMAMNVAVSMKDEV